MKYEYHQEVIFTKEECEKIIELHKIYPASKKLRILENKMDFETNRVEDLLPPINGKKMGKSFYVYDIFRDESTNWIFEKITNWFINVTNIQLKKDKIKGNFGLLNYRKGDFFMKHTDIIKNFESRRWTINLQLNNEYTGGNFLLYTDNGEIILNKEPGNAIVYWAGMEHEVEEITEGERWSIVYSIGKDLILEETKKLL